jgi:asparagine synthase (glutamine-hydrolysing)
MQSQSSRPVRTFSIGFHESQYNEAAYAKAVAEHLRTDHTELYVTPREAMDVIPELSGIFDEPFADTSQIPTLLLARMARRHVTVSLSGDGGDELFGGYSRYLAAERIERTVRAVPQPLRSLVAGALSACPRAGWDGIFSVINPMLPAERRLALPGEKMHKLAKVLRSSESGDVYRQMLTHWDEPSRLVRGAGEHPTVISELNGFPEFNHSIHRMMFLDLMCYLPDEVMVKVDRATMAASLEAREPLLDYRLAEFAWRLPLGFKIADGRGKWILRKILYRYVPPELVERPKMGFGVPLGAWLRGPLREWAGDLLSPAALESDGVFNAEPITAMWKRHLEGRYNFQYYLWDVLMAQSWMRQARA